MLKNIFFLLSMVFLSGLICQNKARASTYSLVASEVKNYVQLADYENQRDLDRYSGWEYYRQVCHQSLDDLDPKIKEPIKKVAEKLQFALFAQQIFQLKLCFVDAIATDLQERTIYINAVFISKLVASLATEKVEPVLAAVIGHEIGHYLYEQILRAKSPSQSALGHKDSWFESSQTNNAEERYLIHGEIDAIGLNIAEWAGYDLQMARDVLDRVEAVLNGRSIPGKSSRQSVIDAYLLPFLT